MGAEGAGTLDTHTHTHTHILLVSTRERQPRRSGVSDEVRGCRARRQGLGQRETAQVAGRTAEGEGGPQAGIYGCSEAAGSMRRMDRSKKRLHLRLPMLGQAGGSGGQGNGERIEGGKPLQSPGLRGVQMVPCTGPPRTSKMHKR